VTNASFTPVSRRTVSSEIREQLLANIADGRLAPGDRVPSERTLCDEFGVARTSVREAIQGLVSVGVIERRGNRSYVAEHLPGVELEIDHRKLRVRELFEVRRVIELPLFELAAERATDEQRAEITRLAGRFRIGMDLDSFRAFDRSFHRTIAAACANPLLFELYGKVLDALFGSDEFASLLGASSNQEEVSGIIGESAADHVRIAVAIADGDPVATAAAVERHLSEVERRMLELSV